MAIGGKLGGFVDLICVESARTRRSEVGRTNLGLEILLVFFCCWEERASVAIISARFYRSKSFGCLP